MKEVPFPARFAAWREFRNLTQEEVGASIGRTKQTISYVENGTADLSVAQLNIVCRKAFKTDLATFFGPLPGRAEP